MVIANQFLTWFVVHELCGWLQMVYSVVHVLLHKPCMHVISDIAMHSIYIVQHVHHHNYYDQHSGANIIISHCH